MTVRDLQRDDRARSRQSRLPPFPCLAPLITAIGMSFIVQNIALAFYGVDYRSVPELHPDHERRRHRRYHDHVEEADGDPDRRAVAPAPQLVRVADRRQGHAGGRTGPREASAMMGIDVNRTIPSRS
jgi:hypothetical protein